MATRRAQTYFQQHSCVKESCPIGLFSTRLKMYVALVIKDLFIVVIWMAETKEEEKSLAGSA